MEDASLSDLSDGQLEGLVLNEHAKASERGAAKAELVRRQRKYELERDQKKREHDVALFNAQSDLARLSHEFEERLARESQAHAEALAEEQASPARNAAAASIWAAAAATLSALAAIISGGVAYWAYNDAHSRGTIAAATPAAQQEAARSKQNDSASDPQAPAPAPIADFYTETDVRAPVIGIQIQNEDVAPLTVSRVEYFVDGLPVRGADDATNHGRFLGPDRIQTLDLAAGDRLATGEKDWLYFRSTKSKTELPKFVDFIANHVAIGITLCNDAGRCTSRCSEAGKCGPDYNG